MQIWIERCAQSWPYRFRAKINHFERVQRLLSSYASILGDIGLWVGVPRSSSALVVPLTSPGSQGPNLALTVFHVPCLLEIGGGRKRLAGALQLSDNRSPKARNLSSQQSDELITCGFLTMNRGGPPRQDPSHYPDDRSPRARNLWTDAESWRQVLALAPLLPTALPERERVRQPDSLRPNQSDAESAVRGEAPGGRVSAI